MPTKLDAHQLVRSLNSTTCPACGGRKGRAKSLCGPQYFQLPPVKRRALYNRVGDGYEQAMAEALQFLKAAHFHEPAAAKGAQ